MTSDYNDYNDRPKRPTRPTQGTPRSRDGVPVPPRFTPKSRPANPSTANQPRSTNQPRTRISSDSVYGNGSGNGKNLRSSVDINQYPPFESAPLPNDSSEKFPRSIPRSLLGSLLGMKWLRSWPLVMLIIFGIVGVSGTAAVVSLFRIPNLPNCRAIFWPTASASLRLQCAESYAAEGDVKNLLAAIALVDKLPEDHPLRSDIINDRIEDWANQVLDLAERSFENGELEQAINSARKIPSRTAAADVVEERIERWQKIWKEGEDGFNSAVEKLKAKDFQSAFTLSVALLDVNNKHWSTTKYNELTKLISVAREDSRHLSEALGLAKKGTVKGFTDALKKLREIEEGSVFFAEVQSTRKDIAKEMLETGESLLAARNLSGAQAMLSAIPRDTGLDAEIQDFQIFVTAYQQAWTNNASGLENAINRMKTLKKNRPLYAKGQRLIAQWQSELQDVALLNQAKERATRGGTADLTAAISIAQQISRNSPQWDLAADQIGDWRVRVETVQDRPILERADRLATGGSPDALRAAIQEARKVSSGRTLGAEASERIATWTGRVQRIEDQPVLDQARARASTGDRAGAIAIASRIGQGRALYGAAQEEIGRWQVQESGRQRLGEATNAAARGDAEGLSSAIDIASRVPAGSDSRSRADSQINRWSWDLLRQAETTSGRNLETAITLASRIPSQAEAYDSAQVRIRNWQEMLRRIEAARQPIVPAPSPGEGPEVDENGEPPRLNLRSPAE